MARDRQRAKARKARRAAQGPTSVDPILGGPAKDLTGGEHVPGTEHLSGEVDEFEARMAEQAGAPADAGAQAEVEEQPGAAHPDALSDAEFDELADSVDDVEEAFESGDEQEIERAERAVVAKAKAAPAPGAPTKRGRGRTIAFLRASWAELQRVQWPDRRQVGQATAVVLGFVVVAGLFLGLADAVAKKIVDIII